MKRKNLLSLVSCILLLGCTNLSADSSYDSCWCTYSTTETVSNPKIEKMYGYKVLLPGNEEYGTKMRSYTGKGETSGTSNTTIESKANASSGAADSGAQMSYSESISSINNPDYSIVDMVTKSIGQNLKS